jgi:hypothetical protein
MSGNAVIPNSATLRSRTWGAVVAQNALPIPSADDVIAAVGRLNKAKTLLPV